MSKQRIGKPGCQIEYELKKNGGPRRGPSGRRICRMCDNEIPTNKRIYCSEKCSDEWNIRTNPSAARWHVQKRDEEVCSHCGLDTKALSDALGDLALVCPPRSYGVETAFQFFIRDNALPYHRHFWEAHHIHAVVEGGGECGLDGYETLCWRCHKKETAELARWRAEVRKGPRPKQLRLL